MVEKNRVPPGPGFIKNRGGRPRKDGTRADSAKTLADLGISKRRATLARLYASVSEAELEAAMDQREAEYAAGGRLRPIKDFLPDRRANRRHERETGANIARIISTAQRIVKAHEFDTSEDGSRLRHMAVRTVERWAQIRSMLRRS